VSALELYGFPPKPVRFRALAKLEHYIGGAQGRKNFWAHEVTTEPNGELLFQLTPDPTKAKPPSHQIQALNPEIGMATPQDSPPNLQGIMDGKLDANTNGEESEARDIYTKWFDSLQDSSCLEGEICRQSRNQLHDTAYEGFACPPEQVRSTDYLVSNSVA